MTTTIDKITKDDLFLPVLRALDDLGGSGRNEEINNHVIEAMAFGPDELPMLVARLRVTARLQLTSLTAKLCVSCSRKTASA